MPKKRGLSEERAKPLRAGRKRTTPTNTAAATVVLPRESTWAKIGPGGRIVIPSSMRKALGLGEGDHLVLQLFDEELHAIPKDIAIRRAQEMAAEFAPSNGRSSADELIAERRRAFEREERGE